MERFQPAMLVYQRATVERLTSSGFVWYRCSPPRLGNEPRHLLNSDIRRFMDILTILTWSSVKICFWWDRIYKNINKKSLPV